MKEPRSRAVVGLAVFATINLLLGFLQSLFLTTSLGANEKTDAIYAGATVPQLVLAIVGNSIANVITPILAAEKDDHKRRKEAWGLLIWVGLFHIGLSVLLIGLARFWVPLTVPGFAASTVDLTIQITSVHLIGMIFMALFTVLRCVYNAENRLLVSEVNLLLANFVGMAFLYFGLKQIGPVAGAWALTIEIALPALVMMIQLGRFEMPDMKSPTLREIWQRLRPLLVGTAYYKTEFMFERALTSLMPPGTLALVGLAQQLYSAGNTVIYKVFTGPLVPKLGRLAHQEDWPAFSRLAKRSLMATVLLSLGALAFIGVVGQPILKVVFVHGRIHHKDVHMLWLIMLALFGVWIGRNAGLITSSAYYSRGKTRRVAIINSIVYTIFLPIRYFATSLFGVFGMTLSASAFWLTNLIAQLDSVREKD